jgi:2-C-methyl-D-erythritol 4-phosphate cytidylyltransferase
MNPSPIPGLCIVIPAAGLGRRLGLGPKALLPLGDHSLLHWVSAKARTLAAEVIVAAPPDATEQWARHCPQCRVIAGGETHLQSMAKLIQAATLPWFMNINVVMPFASTDLIRRVVAAAKVSGIAAAILPVDLPVARISHGAIVSLLPRQETAIAQGPNAYLRDHLLSLIDRADASDWQRQSFLEIAMRHGYPITAVPGEPTNIKITNQEDWQRAQHLKEFLQ